ncbi:MAG: class I SAM-dependent methyltransferase, partial [bacterium]|nr:class I SAM-dependent methyltransferase [bacterium]
MNEERKNTEEFRCWQTVIEAIPESSLPMGRLATYNLLNKGSHLFFSFSRYKFAAKMVNDNKNVLELGCSEALGTLLFTQNNCRVKAVDFDHEAIDWSKKHLTSEKLKFMED